MTKPWTSAWQGLAALTIFGGSQQLSSQTITRTLSPDQSCVACRLEVQRVATLGALDDTIDLRGSVSVVGRLGGPYYVASSASPTVYVFGGDGRLTRRIGRRGQGPGEFQVIRSLALTRGDSLVVFDVLRRVTVFSPQHAFVRTFSIPLALEEAVVFPNGTLVGNGVLRTRNAAGHPLHLFSENDRQLKSFAGEPAIVDPDRPRLNTRHLTYGDENTFWASHSTSYTLEQRLGDGPLLRVLLREAPWFPRSERYVPRPVSGPEGTTAAYRLTTPPEPFVRGLGSEPKGRLLVMVAVADERWKDSEIWLGEGHSLTPEKLGAMYDTLVEIIDPIRGLVLASARLPFFPEAVAGPGIIVSLRTVADGHHVVDVWHVRLRE